MPLQLLRHGEGEGAGGGCSRGSFQCTNIFKHEKLMISYCFRAKSVHSNYLKLYVISSVSIMQHMYSYEIN